MTEKNKKSKITFWKHEKGQCRQKKLVHKKGKNKVYLKKLNKQKLNRKQAKIFLKRSKLTKRNIE